MRIVFRINDIKYLLAALVVIVTIFVVQTVASSILLLPVIVALTLYFLTRPNGFEKQPYIAIAVLLIGNVLIGYTYALMLSLYICLKYMKLRKFRADKVSFIIAGFIFLAICAFLFSQVVEINLLALPLSIISFFCLLGVFFYFRSYQLSDDSKEKIINLIIFVAIVETLIAYFAYVRGAGVIQVLTFKRTPDLVTGTLGNANNFAIFLFISSFLVVVKYLKTRNLLWLLTFPYLLLYGFLADAKSFLIGIFLAGGFLFARWIWFNSGLLKRIALITISFIFLSWFIPAFTKLVRPVTDLLYEMYVVGEYNHKYLYISRALDYSNRNPIQYLIGTGPGTCGSRSANSRAYDSMHKTKDSFALTALPPKTSVYANDILVDLFQYDYAIKSRYRSALLGNPFNSWTAIYVEFGLLGFLLLCFFFTMIGFHLLKANAIEAKVVFVLLISIVIAGFVDQTFERPIPMILLYFLCGLTLPRKKLIE